MSDGKTALRPSYGGIKHAVSSIGKNGLNISIIIQNTINVLEKIMFFLVKSEGVKGMYAGMSPNIGNMFFFF